MSPAADEIARIEHELDILRSRYAIFRRWARITKWYFIALAVIVPSFVVTYAPFDDPLAVVIVAGIVIVIGAGLYLARDRDYRWIDAVSPPPGWPRGNGFGPWSGPKSEAEAIETMIAEREARLAEIKNRPA
jgi:hypothetical protein